LSCQLYRIESLHLPHTTVDKTPLDEGSARRRDLYLTTQTSYKRQMSMSPVGFEPTIPASARPQTYALDCAATGIGGYRHFGTILLSHFQGVVKQFASFFFPFFLFFLSYFLSVCFVSFPYFVFSFILPFTFLVFFSSFTLFSYLFPFIPLPFHPTLLPFVSFSFLSFTSYFIYPNCFRNCPISSTSSFFLCL
jgi:hypothetical protein